MLMNKYTWQKIIANREVKRGGGARNVKNVNKT